jgi:hypothetical protein
MKPDLSEAMLRTRRADSQRRATLVLAATDAVLVRGSCVSIAGIARAAGVGRKFIYDHPELKADIELKVAQATQRHANDLVSSARVSGASLRADLENARAQNQRLTGQLRALERRLSETEGTRLVTDDLLPAHMVTELADRQLAERFTELERQLFQVREDLRRATEELEAARAINRELMHRANRPVAESPMRPANGSSSPPPVLVEESRSARTTTPENLAPHRR